MFDQFSERARRVVFLARELASTNGNDAALEPSHLVSAIIREDQGEFARRPNILRTGRADLQPAHPFFAADTASAALVDLEQILPPKKQPIPLSTDLGMSAALQHIFTASEKLAKELHHERVEPLHLLAAALSEKSERSSEIVNQLGISREAAIAALQE